MRITTLHILDAIQKHWSLINRLLKSFARPFPDQMQPLVSDLSGQLVDVEAGDDGCGGVEDVTLEWFVLGSCEEELVYSISQLGSYASMLCNRCVDSSAAGSKQRAPSQRSRPHRPSPFLEATYSVYKSLLHQQPDKPIISKQVGVTQSQHDCLNRKAPRRASLQALM
jgi:hypothetical protein